MGATEAGGTKSPRLLSVLRRWRAGRRLRRMRSAFRAERKESTGLDSSYLVLAESLTGWFAKLPCLSAYILGKKL